MKIVETPRLILRRFQPNDLDALAPILSIPEVMHFSASGVKTRQQTEELLHKNEQ